MSLSANRLVAEGVPGQAELLVGIVERDVMPHAVFLRTHYGAARPDVRSYTGALLEGPDGQPSPPLRGHAARLVHYAGHLGLDLTVDQIGHVETLEPDEIVNRAKEVSRNPKFHGALALGPLEETRRDTNGRRMPSLLEAEVAAAIDPRKDLDFNHPWFSNLNGSRPIPPTPLATIDTLRTNNLWRPGLRYVLQGAQGNVGAPIASELRKMYKDEYQRMVVEIERANAGQLPYEMAEADVVIAAAGALHAIKAEDLQRAAEAGRLKAIAGIGLHDFEPGAREVAAELGIRTTPEHMDPEELGVGGGTAFHAWGNTLHNAAVVAGLAEPRIQLPRLAAVG